MLISHTNNNIYITSPTISVKSCYHAQMGTLVKWGLTLAVVSVGGTFGVLHHAQIWAFIIDITHDMKWSDLDWFDALPRDATSAQAWPS